MGNEEIDFDFDFRYYIPYTGGLVPGGLYVFKTVDSNSAPYNHKLKLIKVFSGAKSSMFVITYVQKNGALSTVKIRLPEKETSRLEFDVFFSYLDKKKFLIGQEVTINWSAHYINSHGIFYTDSNAYRVIERNVWKNKTYPERQ